MAKREYDARRNPQRGVRIEPLPRYMHARFRRLLDQLRHHARSHKGTWRLALAYQIDPMTLKQAMFWDNATKYLNIIEYYGTANDDSRRGDR